MVQVGRLRLKEKTGGEQLMTRRSRAAVAAAAASGAGAGDESHGGSDTMILRRKDDDLSAVGDGFCVDDNKDGDLLEYDPEPVFRRMGTLNCKDSCCPNFGGRCPCECRPCTLLFLH